VSQVDRMLPTLFAHAGADLVLATGQEPTLRLEGRAPVQLVPRKLEAAHVRFLMGEILDASALATLERDGALDFVYASSGHPRVTVSVRGWHEESPFARLRPYQRAGASPPVVSAVKRRSLPMAIEGALGAEPAAPPVEDGPVLRSTLVDAGAPITLDALLRYVVANEGSDLHLSTGQPPSMRRHGSMTRIGNLTAMGEEALMKLVAPALPARSKEEFAAHNDTDFAHEIPGLSRFRVNLFRDREGPGIVARTIPAQVISADKLNLPPAVRKLSMLAKGLVLVTGPTGSGKSTTLAALIDLVNRERDDHIITLEDPIEFVHQSRRCFINQREVGVHTKDFKRALRAALREDPDIVLVGEMRDLETVAIAIETAETGHLVFGTLHTTTAISTVDRIIDQFPGERQAQIRAMLAESLKAVIAQTLCRKIGGGRVAALEVLLSTPAVANLIREGKTFQLASVMQTSRKAGMTLLNDALVSLVLANEIEPREAYLRAIDKNGLLNALVAAGRPFEPGAVEE
jgi:twitching motility protein PilT